MSLLGRLFTLILIPLMAGFYSSGPWAATPVIESYSPQSGRSGTSVTIRGQNFGSAYRNSSGVYFGSTKASRPSSWSDSQILVTAPSGRGSVSLRVVNSSGQSSTAKTWTYTTQGGSGGTGGGAGGGTSGLSNFKVFANNDLGMHCVDKDFSVFSILPPFNVVNAQVIGQDSTGKPRLLSNVDGIKLQYSPIADATGSINSYSVGKTNFWDFSTQLFGAVLAPGQGLKGLYMPGDVPAGTAVADKTGFGWDAGLGLFSAGGIPIIPKDDAGLINHYPLMRVTARNAAGVALAATDTVLPVSEETDCGNCHATGKRAASEAGIAWSTDPDLDRQARTNILILHDADEGTNLKNSTPVLCASCHYSPALDLAGTGPVGEQVGKPMMSAVMHKFHADKIDNGSGKTVYDAPAPVAGVGVPPADQQACYQCHPGANTKCLRGAMTDEVTCQNCHGSMSAVGAAAPLKSYGPINAAVAHPGGTRIPWLDEPRCQSCHTGDAVNHATQGPLASDGLRQMLAYDPADPAASPLLAANTRFAEEPNKLFRHSKGHGGVACESCHGSTHAIWPGTPATTVNDDVTATQLQGHVGTIAECATCHRAGSLPRSGSNALNGPHGLHVIGDARFADGGHEDLYESNPAACQACHGADLRGTVLSSTTTDRSFNIEGRTKRLPKGTQVGCYTCHNGPNGD